MSLINHFFFAWVLCLTTTIAQQTKRERPPTYDQMAYPESDQVANSEADLMAYPGADQVTNSKADQVANPEADQVANPKAGEEFNPEADQAEDVPGMANIPSDGYSQRNDLSKVFDIPFGSYGDGPNYDEITNDFTDETENEATGSETRNVIRKKKLKWPKGEVPYEIETDKYRKSDVSMIKAAIEEFHKHTCIRFIKRHPNIKNFVKITARGDGCSTYVGRRKLYEHKVTLETPACMKKGTVIHELMHALGIYHEHMRPDRDKFIQINWANIAQENQNNFITLKIEDAQVFNLTYDYGSLMHYSPYAFAVNKTVPSMVPINIPSVRAQTGKAVKIGQRIQFSPTDIKKINYLYECHKNKKFNHKKVQ